MSSKLEPSPYFNSSRWVDADYVQLTMNIKSFVDLFRMLMAVRPPVEWSGTVWHWVRDVKLVKIRLFLLMIGAQMVVVARHNHLAGSSFGRVLRTSLPVSCDIFITCNTYVLLRVTWVRPHVLDVLLYGVFFGGTSSVL